MERAKPLVPQARLRLDWRAYWREFKRVHGEPVPFGNRLLFPDGWMYSAFDHRGPEWPPDAEEVRLRRLYLLTRRREVRHQIRAVATGLEALEQLQRTKSAPVMVSELRLDDDGKPVRTAVPLDLGSLRRRLAWLETELVRVRGELCRTTDSSTAATSSTPTGWR